MVQNNVLTRYEVYDQFCMVQLHFKFLSNKFFIFRGVGYDDQDISVFVSEQSLSEFVAGAYPDLVFENVDKLIFNVDLLTDLENTHFLIFDKANNILYQD